MIVEFIQNGELNTATENIRTPLWLLIIGSSLVTSVVTVLISKFFEFRLKKKDLENQVAKELFQEKLQSLRMTMSVFNELRLSEEVGYNGRSFMNLMVFKSKDSLTDICNKILEDLNQHFHKPRSIEEPLEKIYILITYLGRKALGHQRLFNNTEIVGCCASEYISKWNLELHDACVAEMDKVMKDPAQSLKLATGFIEIDPRKKVDRVKLEDMSNQIIEKALTVLDD